MVYFIIQIHDILISNKFSPNHLVTYANTPTIEVSELEIQLQNDWDKFDH